MIFSGIVFALKNILTRKYISTTLSNFFWSFETALFDRLLAAF
jgi:hypothetical protein